MLALVKKPRIEISIHGERTAELVEWIRKKYDVAILTSEEEAEEEYVSIESTEYWNRWNRTGSATCLPEPT